MKFFAPLNKILEQRLGISVQVTGLKAGLRRIQCQELTVMRGDKEWLYFQKIEFQPQWKLSLKLSSKFNFQFLRIKRFEFGKGEGLLSVDRKELLLDIKTDWQSQRVHLLTEMFWHEPQGELDGSQWKFYLESLAQDHYPVISLSTNFRMQAPFVIDLQLLFTKEYLAEKRFEEIQWEGYWNAEQMIWDQVRSTQFQLKTQKKASKQATLTLTSDGRPKDIKGKVTLKKPEHYEAEGSIALNQPLLSRYIQKHLKQEGFSEKMTFDGALKAKGATLIELWQDIQVHGSFDMVPKETSMFTYGKTHGTLAFTRKHFDVNIPKWEMNGGKAKLHYFHEFDKLLQLTIDVRQVEALPFFELLRYRYRIQGVTHGILKYHYYPATEHHELELDANAHHGEIIGQSELIDRWIPSKELKDLRKQLLHIEGFRKLHFQVKKNRYEWLIQQIVFEGHLKQKLRLLGTIQSTGKLDLLLEATFAELASLVFTIKGSHKAPIMLPAPAKTAEQLLKNSGKIIKELLKS